LTCMSTRAVHLEVVDDMTAESFLNAIRRFIARRGKPKQFISDNAKHYILTDKVLSSYWQKLENDPSVQSYMSSEGISWKYIVELAPWMGGFYERMVGIVKRSLKKALGKNLVTNDHLNTLLIEIEAVVNSRPLFPVGNELEDPIALTPAHLITVNPRLGSPEFEPVAPDGDPEYVQRLRPEQKLLLTWRRNQEVLNAFWKIWRNQYLQELRERSRAILKTAKPSVDLSPTVGTVVLIAEEHQPRGKWRLGKLVELLPSSDGLVRKARVLLADKKVLNRSISQLYPLEMDTKPEALADDPDMPVQEPEKEDPAPDAVSARPSRRAKDIAQRRIGELFSALSVVPVPGIAEMGTPLDISPGFIRSSQDEEAPSFVDEHFSSVLGVLRAAQK